MALYLLSRGEYSDYGIVAILEGPADFDIDAEFKKYEQETGISFGSYEYDTVLKNRKKEASRLEMGELDESYAIFAAHLQKDKGFKEVQFSETNIGL